MRVWLTLSCAAGQPRLVPLVPGVYLAVPQRVEQQQVWQERVGTGQVRAGVGRALSTAQHSSQSAWVNRWLPDHIYHCWKRAMLFTYNNL